MGAGKGGGFSGIPTTAFRVGRVGTAFLLGASAAGLAARLVTARFSSALLSWRSLADLPPILRPVFRSGRAFAIEHPTLLATPGAVNSVSAP